MKKSIYDFSRLSLEQYFVEKDIAKYRATQVYEAVYRQRVKDFKEIKNIKKDIINILDEEFVFGDLETIVKKESQDETVKFLFSLGDNNLIETVLMKQEYGYSVCVTTQVGCNMGCAFCASGTVKKIRNLEVSEIVLQVLIVDNYLKEKYPNTDKRVSHVVVMGIGEPFDNYDNVIEFIKIINDDKGLQIGSRHITVSTCGIVPKIKEFSDLPLQVNLAISLHFSSNEKRNEYMKINRKYPLEQLIEAVNYYYEKTNRRITFEYILLDSINDSIEDAKKLVYLVRNINCFVNLIPYNDTNSIFKRSSNKRRDEFFEYLIKNRIQAVTRKELGSDIDAACGQLRVKKMKDEQ